MTRDEALNILTGNLSTGLTLSDAEKWLYAFDALGMLELDEPKSVEERVRDQARHENSYSYATEIFMGMIDRAGLKIVDK